MGVHSLWDIVGPAARPVKLEALSRKRLAVDASIWIYQFMKAVRDKEGNSLGQTHIVGFFRRICKMLFFGILPLFVFDGGAPPLKRQVIQARKERRQGNQENAASTAQKLLAMQMHRKAGSRGQNTKKTVPSGSEKAGATAENDNNLYFDDLPMHHDERPPITAAQPVVSSPKPENRPETFRRKDEYHLPDIKQFTVRKDDQRIMPEGELEDYAAEQSWDVVDGIPIDSVDPSSAEFAELPMATQYMILSHLRLRSRLRLGYSKDQLEHLFPNSRDFSKFQIQQVQKRNYYTQKLMNVSGMSEDTGNVTRRIAGDKDRQYMLVKNEGGWTLSLGSGENEDNAIELDEGGEVEGQMSSQGINSLAKRETENGIQNENESGDSDDDLLEDVPLDNGAKVANSPKLEDDSDDELVSKAVIESIYDQYKHEYDDGPDLPQKDALLPESDASIQQNIENFRDTDLQKAIEESKKDYYKQKQRESELQQNLTEKPVPSEFEFGNSLLFGAPMGENTEPTLVEETERKDSTAASGAIDIDDQPDTTKEPEKEPTDSPKQTNIIPSWFNDSSHLQSPYASIGFLSDTQENRKIDENEEAGLIPWNEAKRYFEERSGHDKYDENQVETINEEGESDSDLEIIEEIVKEAPNDGKTKENSLEKNSKNSDLGESEDNPVFAKIVFAKEGSTKSRKVPNKITHTAKPTPLKSDAMPISEESLSNDVSNGTADANSKDSNTGNAQKPSDSSEIPQGFTKPQQNIQILDYDFDESEEEDLVKQLREEEQEHVQFTSSIQLDKIPIHTKVSNEQLLQEQLQKAKRDAEEVTQTMINDVQELLKRFGIPYITAPMEAEAQCAELYKLGLVDGIVTDDSDCFLFGGSRIYKNMFNQKQYVECYIADDIEHKVGLDQKKLIELALLLGSDYTEGVKGIGPVLAMEILADFGSLDAFKDWFDETTKTLKKPEANRNSKLEKTLLSRIKNGKLFLADTFPDPVVVDAYKRPEVDHDKSEFKWGVPSLDQIRSFLMYNVGWSQERVDEVMVPLIRNINKTRTEGQQTTISEFFPQEYISYRKDVGMGKRMKAAADRIRGD